MMEWFFAHYLRSMRDASDPRIDLIHADMSRLPNSTVIAGELDPLLSEDEMLVTHLRDEGIKTYYAFYAGVTHDFFGMGDVVSEASDAQDVVASALREAFALPLF